MTSKHYLAVALVSLGVAAASFGGTGCGGGGSGETGGTGGSGTGGTNPSTSSSSSGSPTTTSSSSSSSSGGTGNHDFDSAIDIGAETMPTPGTLVDAATADFYKFDGMKGDHVIILGLAQELTGNTDLQDPTVADTVVSLYDSNKNLIASDDDAWPRNNDTDSVLFSVLPATGTYYIKIEDCNSYSANNPSLGINCAPPDPIVTLDYTIQVGKPNETVGKASAATTVAYTDSSTAGVKNGQALSGSFGAAGEKHAFNFAAPADLLTDPAAHPAAYFYLQPSGIQDGDGSTTNVKLYISSDSTCADKLAYADQVNFTNGDDSTNGPMQFSFPLDTANLTKQYTLCVEQGGGTSKPDSDFYFIWHEIGSIFYGESEVTTAHADMASAQGLTVPGTNEGTFFVWGNLATATELDWYKLPVPAMVTNSSSGMSAPDHVYFGCDVERWGSGLKSFSVSLLSSDGTTVIKTITETNPAKTDLLTGYLKADELAIPAGLAGKNAFLKVTAASQDASNTGNYYHCQAVFFTTQ